MGCKHFYLFISYYSIKTEITLIPRSVQEQGMFIGQKRRQDL